jgi:uncharacterized protein (DUF983 family)
MLNRPFKDLDIAAQVTGGVCPTCTHETMLVSLTPEIYRCVNCGADCKQYINGSIRYLPAFTNPTKLNTKSLKT